MNLWPFRRKASPVAGVSGFEMPVPQTWDVAAAIRDGYQSSAVVYAAIREITTAAAALDIEVHQAGEYIDGHPALSLINNPNPMTSGAAFIRALMIDYHLQGEIAIARAPAGDVEPSELWRIDPRRIVVEPGASGLPLAYVYEHSGRKTRFAVDQVTGASDLFFMRAPNPADPWRGQPPIRAGALAADTHSAGLRWNYQLLRNSARPSGVIEWLPGMEPGPEAQSRVSEWLHNAMAGDSNAGKVANIVGGKFVAAGHSPTDMDWIAGLKEAQKLVASALGVPIPLVDNDASTFNNMAIAKERLYTDTVIPIMQEFLANLSAWLLPAFGEGLQYRINMDAIPALEEVRARTYQRVVSAKAAGILTADEAREAIGYPPLTDDQRAELDPVGAAIAAGQAEAQGDPDEAARSAYGAASFRP